MNENEKMWYAFPFLLLSVIYWFIIADIIKSMGYPDWLMFGIFTCGIIINFTFYTKYIDRISL